MPITSQYLASKEKAVIATSKVEALEVEASSLRKDLIATINDKNSFKEKIKALTKELEAKKQLVKQNDKLLATASQKMKNVVAKAVYAFQTTEEYNAILFGWYFKGFELLRRYLVKHGPSVDMEELDFEAVDKEIKVDVSAQASQVATITGDNPQDSKKDVDDAPVA